MCGNELTNAMMNNCIRNVRNIKAIAIAIVLAIGVVYECVCTVKQSCESVVKHPALGVFVSGMTVRNKGKNENPGGPPRHTFPHLPGWSPACMVLLIPSSSSSSSYQLLLVLQYVVLAGLSLLCFP